MPTTSGPTSSGPPSSGPTPADADPDVFATRQALAALASGAPSGRPLLVACSGGADSLALAAAAVWQRRRESAAPVIGVTVDHGLQEESTSQAQRVVTQLAELGVDETVSVRVRVAGAGRGPEAAAREARYAVLAEVAGRFDAAVVALGHTLDDQAETVLLGLARGSGARALRGMRAAYSEDGVRFERPFLGLRRAQTEAACRAQGIEWWDDPHNRDPRYARSRVRHDVLPVVERELGPGIAEALARTGRLLSADEALLTALTEEAMTDYDPEVGFEVAALSARPEALRLRMLREAALRAGVPPADLALVHLDALDAQVANRTHLPRTIELPGKVVALREGDSLRLSGRAN